MAWWIVVSVKTPVTVPPVPISGRPDLLHVMVGSMANPVPREDRRNVGHLGLHASGENLDGRQSVGPHVGLDLPRSEEHTSELQSRGHLVCRLLLEKKKRAQ